MSGAIACSSSRIDRTVKELESNSSIGWYYVSLEEPTDETLAAAKEFANSQSMRSYTSVEEMFDDLLK